MVILFSVILFFAVTAGVVFWLALRSGRASLRLMAGICFLAHIGFGFFEWLVYKESWVLVVTTVLGVMTSLGLLSLPLTAPKTYKKLNIKW